MVACGPVAGGAEPDVFGADRDLDIVAGLMPAGRATVSVSPPATATVPGPITRAGTRLTRPMKSATTRLAGLRIDLLRRAVLLQPAAVDHRDLVGQRQRLGLVVGDVDEGDAGAALQALQLDAHLLAELGVEVGQRLVEQQDFRLDHEAAGQRHALLLAAGELVRIALLQPGQIDQRQRVARPSSSPPPTAFSAPSGRTRRSRTRSCAATPRSSGTPCPCRAGPAAPRCRAPRAGGR